MSTDAVKSKVSTHLQVVTFHLGSEDFAVEITKVKEIILFEEITKVPQCAAYIEGVINLRGSIVPVIDLRKRLGMAHKELVLRFAIPPRFG
jgi:purine-binding chemotaxis protein CheW